MCACVCMKVPMETLHSVELQASQWGCWDPDSNPWVWAASILDCWLGQLSNPWSLCSCKEVLISILGFPLSGFLYYRHGVYSICSVFKVWYYFVLENIFLSFSSFLKFRVLKFVLCITVFCSVSWALCCFRRFPLQLCAVAALLFSQYLVSVLPQLFISELKF